MLLLKSHKTTSNMSTAQVINTIKTGPYKNIYNPENFYVHKGGTGAGNNWATGYSMGDSVYEEAIGDMIDREADGSDSLEVSLVSDRESCSH